MRPIRKAGIYLFRFAVTAFLLLSAFRAGAQQIPVGTPTDLHNAPQRDTANKTNKSDWVDEQTVIYYRKLNSNKHDYPDTSLHTFHRRPFSQPWYRDLGNTGSPVTSMLFTPESRTGPTLGYHVFDPYMAFADSLVYYNTTRPYSSFGYRLGSKAEQVAEILHTQNILPGWNVALQFRKINSPGYYKIQRTNDDVGGASTSYLSKRQHYQLNAAFVYNKFQQDENGGIVADSFLTDAGFSDRQTVPVLFQNDFYSTRRSVVTNVFRDFSILLLHGYTWGKTDTLYNEDSTSYTYKLIPRFRVSHRFQIGSQKYQYKDLRPDSLRYAALFNRGFNTGDSVFMQQKWFYLDNALVLNGFIGQDEKQLLFNAGFGNRIDNFATDFPGGGDKTKIISNYLEGDIKKEALKPGQWFYQANARFFLTGDAAGNFIASADLGKDISRFIGNVEAGFQQQVNNAPYNFTNYQNQYYRHTADFNKETITSLHANINNDPLHLSVGIRNYLVANYIYLDQQQEFSQYSSAFNITQIWLRKLFRFGIFVLDNEIAYQQKAGSAPVNTPALMGRHQLSIETYLFGKALKVATGIDARYNTSYDPAGYAPFFNRYYYQDSYKAKNTPELSLFFNFKIRNFRAYVMGDQLQQFFSKSLITAPGYPAQDAMLRFGFNWVLIN